LRGRETKRVKGVEDLNIRITRAQGIVGVGAIIPTCIASSPVAVSRPTAAVGSPAGPTSFSPHNRASARGPTAGQGDPGQRRQNRHPALHSPSNWTIGQS